MFLGAISLFNEKLLNNDKEFFRKFTKVRANVEKILIDNKDLIATILQKHISRARSDVFKGLLDEIIGKFWAREVITQNDLIVFSRLEGKLITGAYQSDSSRISDDQKSKLFINVALNSAIKCPICEGYLDVDKSVSYDHIQRVRDGGAGNADNCQLTHPYCNQSVKN
jgi:hypothetical protein